MLVFMGFSLWGWSLCVGCEGFCLLGEWGISLLKDFGICWLMGINLRSMLFFICNFLDFYE